LSSALQPRACGEWIEPGIAKTSRPDSTACRADELQQLGNFQLCPLVIKNEPKHFTFFDRQIPIVDQPWQAGAHWAYAWLGAYSELSIGPTPRR
jgi:hypothetical protein